MGTLLNRRRYMGGGSADEIIMTSISNPEVMAICYAHGWAAHSDYMTKKEAEAVTSIGGAFNGSNITHFEEMQYFTSVTTLNSNAFKGSTVTDVWFKSITSVSTNGGANVCVFWNCPNAIAVRFDSVTFLGGSYNYNQNSMYTVITTSEIPSTNARWFYGKFYVKDELVNDYKAASGWSGVASRIYSIHQLPTDHPDCPWLNDLREKGFIPTT